MAARLLKFRLPDQEPEPFLDEPDLTSTDVQELASWAMKNIDAVQRAPWTGISQQMQDRKLSEAIQMIQRIQGLRSGAIPTPMFGD